MKNYTYQNNLIGKKQLRHLLAWSFTSYNSMQACALADELKYLGFKYASQAGISISIEDLIIPFVKNFMLKKANQELTNAEKIYLKGKITDTERFQKIIDIWSLTSESLKEEVIYYFKNYDPLNSVYIMSFSGARGNLSQVRQLVGMRGLMSDPNGEIMKLPIKKNFREGLTITDYLMSGYGARKGIVDTALKTANSGYLTRRLIDVGQDILIREKDCLTIHSFLVSIPKNDQFYDKILGRVLNKPVFDIKTNKLITPKNTQITRILIDKYKEKKIKEFYIRSPFTCNLYRSICQKCYGWDLANENLVDIGEAIGIIAGQSIGEPGTQLTMRTFHTGGIFNSETRHQIISPINGIIRFSGILDTVLLRTNRGEDVLITKNSGSVILIPEDTNKELTKIKVLKNTILFPKNNQYVLKNTVIGELINTNKQIKTEIKPIVSNNCGEIFMPRVKKKVNSLNNNKLIWILSGQLYNSPANSFINYYPDYKLSHYSYIFRTKIINHYRGYIEFINPEQNLYDKFIQIINNKYSLQNSSLQKLTNSIKNKDYLLNFHAQKYLLKIQLQNDKFYLQLTQNYQIGALLTTKFKTFTGGILYYDFKNINHSNEQNYNIKHLSRNNSVDKYKCLISYRTITWLGEELHKVNCELKFLFVEDGDFISEGFELIPGLFSKTSGIIKICHKNNMVQTISIKSGLVYEGQKFKINSQKLYYPGETVSSNIKIKKLSFCEHFICKNIDYLLLRPVKIYEVPNSSYYQIDFQSKFNNYLAINLELRSLYSYKSSQIVKGRKNLSLVMNSLTFKYKKFLKQAVGIELLVDQEIKSIDISINEKFYLNNYILPSLRYKNIKSCSLCQTNQFIDSYTILTYLESITSNSLEIVKFKVKNQDTKQILLISNDDCFTVKKNQFLSKKVNNFIITSTNANERGKVIIENDNLFTVQKGKPYFFPNCQNENLINKTNLEYKIVSPTRFCPRLETNRNFNLNYYNIISFSFRESLTFDKLLTTQTYLKAEFSKLFLKRSGKLYSSLVPKFLRKFSISKTKKDLKFNQILKPDHLQKTVASKINRFLMLQSTETTKNQYQDEISLNSQLSLIKFSEYPFKKTSKLVGLYSITEDYFEQDVNNVFCKNGEFIENGATIGLLNFEKEITGDIVQGLPRIEEILEARKKNLILKKRATNQKKGLLLQKTSLDPNFEFRKLGTPIKENEKVNPHKLLKAYFNYYGLIKFFICDKKNEIKYNRLIQNYEGSYKSFKKVQLFILDSVQTVYRSQGVTINDKHLEVIIKQMTTKVLITYEGNTPLLRREVIDLYHIQYINQTVKTQGKQYACYIPLLLGISKAALNNPSFISAASFQETIRVLSKAAIEGHIDWLRGLKENIIIGHLIPAGTGSKNYRQCFRQDSKIKSNNLTKI